MTFQWLSLTWSFRNEIGVETLITFETRSASVINISLIKRPGNHQPWYAWTEKTWPNLANGSPCPLQYGYMNMEPAHSFSTQSTTKPLKADQNQSFTFTCLATSLVGGIFYLMRNRTLTCNFMDQTNAVQTINMTCYRPSSTETGHFLPITCDPTMQRILWQLKSTMHRIMYPLLYNFRLR